MNEWQAILLPFFLYLIFHLVLLAKMFIVVWFPSFCQVDCLGNSLHLQMKRFSYFLFFNVFAVAAVVVIIISLPFMYLFVIVVGFGGCRWLSPASCVACFPYFW